MEDCSDAIVPIYDLLVDFEPAAHQLARKRAERVIPRWQVAMPVVMLALLCLGWLAYRPGVAVAHGTVSLAQQPKPATKFELFPLPEWHDEPGQDAAGQDAPAAEAPTQTADLR